MSSDVSSVLPSAPPSVRNANPPSRERKPALTHFLSIPLHHASGLQTALTAFASSSLAPLDVPRKAIRPAACFHFTLGVMALSETDLHAASTLLESLDLRTLLSDPAPLHISLRGISTMGPLKKTSVLYATPHDPSGRLQSFAEKLRNTFGDAGLLVKDRRELNLHATVVNLIYADNGGRGKWDKSKKRLLDATELVKEHADHVFADDVEIKGVAICKMGAGDLDGVKGGAGYEQVSYRAF